MDDKQKTIEELTKKIKEEEKKLAATKTAALESPFTAIGNNGPIAQPEKRPRGRPPKIDSTDISDESRDAFSQRMSEIERPPPDSTPEQLREFGEKEIHKLIPEAVASLKRDIRYGNSKEMADARAEIFKATGIAIKDANNFGKGGQIVINFGANQGITLPYLERTKKSNSEPSVPIVNTITTKKDGE